MIGPDQRFHTSRALLIGVNDYATSPLATPLVDVAEVGRVLADVQGFSCRELANPTTAEVRGALRELAMTVVKDDRLILYFAGHGVLNEGEHGPEGHVLLRDADERDPSTYLAMSEIAGVLSDLPCRHVLVVMDCCYAGAFRWSGLRDIIHSKTVSRQRYDRFVESPAWQVIVSAAADQTAADRGRHAGISEGGNSPFAAAFAAGLAGAADLNRDGLITASELYVFLRDRVERESEARGRLQTPGLFPLRKHDRGEFVFRNPGCVLELPVAEALTLKANPYRGLAAFEEDDRGLFFGRARVTFGLARGVLRRRLTVVVGPSGSGKSSAVKAGLLPMLRTRGWNIVGPYRPREALDHGLHRAGVPVADGKTTVVVIDQLEEVLQLQPSDGGNELIEALARALADTSADVRIILTVGSDLEPLFQDGVLQPWWESSRYVIPAMTQDELRVAIEGPAEARDLYFNPSRLVDQIINEVIQMPGVLPLLSFTLSELYERMCRSDRGDRALDAVDYSDLGGVARAITHRADLELIALEREDPRHLKTIENVFLRLVDHVAGDVVRRRAAERELVYAQADENERVQRVLGRYLAARLLVRGAEGRTSGMPARTYVEPAHDVLVRGWSRVRVWLAASEGNLWLLRATTHAATAWRDSSRVASYLWSSDPRLGQIKALTRGPRNPFNAVEREFVARSLQRYTRRRMLLVGAIAAVIAGLSIATVMTTRARQRSERLLGAAYLEQGRQWLIEKHRPLRALPYLVAARAAGVDGVPLRMLFSQSTRNLSTVAFPHADIVNSVVWSPDGSRIATASRDGTARAWDAVTGRPATPVLVHGGPVRTVAFSPDGARVITASEDRTAKVWDAATGKQLAQLLGHDGKLITASFSPDGQWILTVGEDKTVRVWDAATYKSAVPPFRHDYRLRMAVFSPDGARILTLSDDVVRLWNVATGGLLPVQLRHRDLVYAAAFSPDGTRIVTASADRTARLWDAATGRPLSGMLRHSHPVVSAVFNPRGDRILTASSGGYAQIWDAATGAPLLQRLESDESVSMAAFCPDGSRVVTASSDHTVRIWNAGNGLPLVLPLEHVDEVEIAAFSPDGSRVATAGRTNIARVWDVSAPSRLKTLERAATIQAATFSADGQRIVTASEDHTAAVWDADTLELAVPAFQHESKVRTAVFSPDRTRILTSSEDSLARLWDVANGKLLFALAHRGAVRAAAFSPDGRRIVTSSEDHTAQVWDAASGQRIAGPLEHEAVVVAASFSPDSLRVVTASADHTARIWDAITGKPISIEVHHADALRTAVFSPDGVWIATAGKDHRVRIWDAATGSPVSPWLEHRTEVDTVSFAPDGNRVVTAGGGVVQVWGIPSGVRVSPPIEHSSVTSAAFSPDGERIVTAGYDEAVRIWDATTGKQLSPLYVHGGPVLGAAFSPDGKRILSAGDRYTPPLRLDGRARVWQVPFDLGDFDGWSRIAASCSPFRLEAGILTVRDFASSCSPQTASGADAAENDLARAANLLFSADAAMVFARRRAHDQYEAAKDLYLQLLDKEQFNVARVSLATLAALDGDLTQARHELNSNNLIDDAELLMRLGELTQNGKQRPDLALRLFEAAAKKQPANAAILADLAECQLSNHRYAAASATVRSAVSFTTARRSLAFLGVVRWIAAWLLHEDETHARAMLLESYLSITPGEILNESYSFNGLMHALRYGPIRITKVEPVLQLLETFQQPVSAATKTRVRQLLDREAKISAPEPDSDPDTEASDSNSATTDVHRRVQDELENQLHASSPAPP